MKRSFIYLFILMLLGFANTALAQNGEIYGTIVDETNAPFEGVRVKVTQGGLQKGLTASESDGSYSIKPLQPGTYEIEFSSQGYGTKKINGVTVSAGGSQKLAVTKMSNDPKMINEVVVVTYKKKLVDKVDVTTSKEIERAPTRDIADMASLNPNVYQARNGAGLSIGGARSDGTVYVLDGQIVSGPVTPAQGTVEQLQVFSSGIPANYGDATGGIVAITSKGMTNKLHGAVQAQHSIDGYNQNLINANATGPLVSRMKDGVKEPILGFMAGVDFRYDADADPTFTKNPVLKSDKLKELQDNPLRLVNSTNGSFLQSSSQFVTKDDFNLQKKNLNNSSTSAKFNGKLDYALNENINVTAGGSYDYVTAQGYSRASSYFAPESIPNQIGSEIRTYLRFKQSFGNSVSRQLNENGRDTSKRPIISNAYYTVQLDYRYTSSKTESETFGRNLFDYGYVGKFTQSRVPTYQYTVDSLTGRQAIILQTYDAVNGITYQASDKNPILSNYTKNVYDYFGTSGRLTDFTGIQGLGGLMNGDFPVYALSQQRVTMNNIGAAMNGYSFSNGSQLGVHADASFDLKPGKMLHAIQFGLYYEQRTSRNYSATVNPAGTGTNSIWNLMNSLTNRHIQGLDKSNPIFMHDGVAYTKEQVDNGSFFLPTDTIIYNRANNGTQSTFDANLRAKLGAGAFDYIDIQSVDPSKLSINMFSADEILNNGQGFVSYLGYDYTGKKLSGQVNFNDFFTQKDASGKNFTRPLAAFHPNYIAGYIMDRFRFQDMNFNVGVRIERYDASTKVMKDPYSLYQYNTIGTTNAALNIYNQGVHPGNLSSNAAVYVDNNQSSSPKIVGYRDGDKWYDYKGVEIPDPTVLKNSETGTGGKDPVPYLVDNVKIKDANFDPNKSFTDYKPTVNVMPRFQFDFPINDGKALFYAHYDILVQRPKVGAYATPLDYYFLDLNQGQIIGNPDLKPEKTFDYELGYQQELTRNSALKISAFYKERKDMIQVRPYLFADPKTYYTYGNRDFSTTKGFSFKYDYRKPQGTNIPIEMMLSYTLQFADGSGSSATSSNGGSGNTFNSSGLLQNFISAGLPNLRFASPLNLDSRHNINLNFNYSYDENEGPTINGKHPLQNLNINMLMRARSGEPYTTYTNVIGNTIQGGLNGTRLGWHFGIDLRMDKTFRLKGFGKKAAGIEVDNARAKYSITAFIYFQNLFNIRDVLGVYPYSQRPDDDGYVASPTGQQYFNSQQYPQALMDLYSLYINNPNNYNGPRRANIGFSFGF